MLIYKDIISGDEMLTDTFKWEEMHDGQIFKVKAKLTSESTKVDDSMFGGNKSAEGADEDEGADDSAQSGLDVKLANRLTDTGFGDKKAYQAYIKEVMGKIVKKMKDDGKSDEDIAKFKSSCTEFVKFVLKKFKDMEFLLGESNNPDGCCCYCLWDDAGENAFFYYIKESLVEEKV